jgi:carbon-monoxide dehydrogenase small subunit
MKLRGPTVHPNRPQKRCPTPDDHSDDSWQGRVRVEHLQRFGAKIQIAIFAWLERKWMQRTISFTLNGKPARVTVDDERMLLWVLRGELGLTGAKFGCGTADCAACTVIVNNEAVRSCSIPMKDIAGKRVLTIEGLGTDGKLHPIQDAFVKQHAFQCGFCTPGMILNAYALLLKNPRPAAEEIVRSMDGNLCRCGSHNRIAAAIAEAADGMKGGTR